MYDRQTEKQENVQGFENVCVLAMGFKVVPVLKNEKENYHCISHLMLD